MDSVADIHYWIGRASSQDEQGAAAIYVTQLDEYLGGSPIQHREMQGSESPRFRSYFRNGLMWVKVKGWYVSKAVVNKKSLTQLQPHTHTAIFLRRGLQQ